MKVIYALLALYVAMPLCADVTLVDFGTRDSPVRPGFTRVTHETIFATNGIAGWLDPAGLEAHDRPIPREPYPPIIYTTDTRRDTVQGRSTATLRVAAADGDVRIWMLAGPGGGAREQVWDIEVSAGSSSARATYYTENGNRALTLKGTIGASGYLDLRITTRSRWALSALVVAPADAWPPPTVKKLQQEAFLLPDDQLVRWEHAPPQREKPRSGMPVDRSGIVVFRRPWVTNIWPDDIPAADELNPTVEAFACPNEYEPLTFTILPGRDFESVMVRVADLVTDDGHVIPSSDIEVRHVRYRWVRPNYKVFGRYYRAPDLLPRFNRPGPLRKDEPFRVWMTVHVRPGAPTGIYTGTAGILLKDRITKNVPIRLRVLPIALEKDPAVTYSTYYKHPTVYINRAPDDFSRQWWTRKLENDMASMAACGYDAFLCKITASRLEDGSWRSNLGDLETHLEVARRHGLNRRGPIPCQFTYTLRKLYRRHVDDATLSGHLSGIRMPPAAFFDEVTAIVEAFEADRKRRGLPEILYYPIDEPTTAKDSIEFMVAIFAAIRKVPGVRTYVTADPARPGFAPLAPYVDVWCSNVPSVTPQQQSEDLDRARPVEHWWYPNRVAGENDHTVVAGARMVYGFGRWRSGYRVLIPWRFEAFHGAPENYLDGYHMDFFNQTDDDASVLPCVRYEAYREGIDDGRYLYTLQRWIARARERDHTDAANDAERDLQAMADTLRVPIEDHARAEAWGWSAETMDDFRWILASRIMQLMRLCGEGMN